ncbi:actin-like protein arp8, partial [Tilletia horrida]
MPKKKGGAHLKWVLQPNPPPDPTQEYPLLYTSIFAPPPINIKNQTSSYMKSESHTWNARTTSSPSKKRKIDFSLAGAGSSNINGKGKAPMYDADLNGEDEEYAEEGMTSAEQ